MVPGDKKKLHNKKKTTCKSSDATLARKKEGKTWIIKRHTQKKDLVSLISSAPSNDAIIIRHMEDV